MQFIKKNYEKVLLGLVLAGLVVIAVFLLILVANEKQAQEERRNRIVTLPIRPLQPPDLTRTDALLKEAAVPRNVNFSDAAHKLFNPERWLKPVQGPLIKSGVGEELKRLELTATTNLLFTVALQSATISDSGARYSMTVEQQASPKPALRPAIPKYASKGEKVVYGDKKEAFVIRDVQGPPENPTALILEFTDPEMTNSISIGKPYRRVDGYMASLRYAPENKMFLNRREGDKISVAQEDYTIVNITESEVMLQGKNQKRWPIKFQR